MFFPCQMELEGFFFFSFFLGGREERLTFIVRGTPHWLECCGLPWTTFLSGNGLDYSAVVSLFRLERNVFITKTVLSFKPGDLV